MATSSTDNYSDFIFYPLYEELAREAKELPELCVNFEVNHANEAIPKYLSSSSSSFRETFQSELTNHFKPVDFQDLQYLAVRLHKISLIALQKKLWNTYFQCATGLFNRDEQVHSIQSSICVRSHQVMSLIVAQRYNNIVNETDVTPDDYINFIREKLFEFDTKHSRFQFQFLLIKDSIDKSIVDMLIYKIKEYIQKDDYTNAIQLHFETRIALLKYNYIDKVFSFKYLQQNPTEEQV